MRMPDGLEVQITGMRAKVARENERGARVITDGH